MSTERGLRTDRDKRDFSATHEPEGAGVTSADDRRYGFQHHVASTDHYDLRLEHDGVLLSWAVAKGPSTDPREKRLSIRTEDHPLDYLEFEGVIPTGQYGGGAVVVWDLGTWAHVPSDEVSSVDDALEQGHLSFRVDGEKLRGGYVLQRFRDEDQWLLIKRDDDGADARRRPTSTEPASVLSGRTVEDVAAGG